MKKSLLVRLAILILAISMLSSCSWSIGGGDKNHDQGPAGDRGDRGDRGDQGEKGERGDPGADRY